MERNDLFADLWRRLQAVNSSLGPEVGDAAVRACRVAIGKTVLEHAEDCGRHKTDLETQGQLDCPRAKAEVSIAYDESNGVSRDG